LIRSDIFPRRPRPQRPVQDVDYSSKDAFCFEKGETSNVRVCARARAAAAWRRRIPVTRGPRRDSRSVPFQSRRLGFGFVPGPSPENGRPDVMFADPLARGPSNRVLAHSDVEVHMKTLGFASLVAAVGVVFALERGAGAVVPGFQGTVNHCQVGMHAGCPQRCSQWMNPDFQAFEDGRVESPITGGATKNCAESRFEPSALTH
jgi:hypothetical protein